MTAKKFWLAIKWLCVVLAAIACFDAIVFNGPGVRPIVFLLAADFWHRMAKHAGRS